MARGFGVDGVGSTDRVETSFASNSTRRSYGFWTKVSSSISGNARVFDKDGTESLWYHTSFNEFIYIRSFSGVDGRWHIPKMTADVYHHVGVSYDSDAPTTTPKFFIDGISQIVSTDNNPSGSVEVSSNPLLIGNLAAANRAWGGDIAEFAIWNRILTDIEWESLARGFSPLFYPDLLVCYVPMVRDVMDRFNARPMVTGGLVANHPRVIHPASAVAS